jgi:hypothetical protein
MADASSAAPPSLRVRLEDAQARVHNACRAYAGIKHQEDAMRAREIDDLVADAPSTPPPPPLATGALNRGQLWAVHASRRVQDSTIACQFVCDECGHYYGDATRGKRSTSGMCVHCHWPTASCTMCRQFSDTGREMVCVWCRADEAQAGAVAAAADIKRVD